MDETVSQEMRLELEKTLRRFALSDMREQAGQELGGGVVGRALRLLDRAGRAPSAPAMAAALSQAAEHVGADNLDNLKLKALAYQASSRWHVYQLGGGERSAPALRSACARVGRALGARVRAVRGPLGGTLLGVGGARRPVPALVFHDSGCLLVGIKKPALVEGIAEALGYSHVKDCHLSGKHIVSLLRLLESRRGLRSQAEVETAAPRVTGPARTALGLDFSRAPAAARALDARLPALTVTAEAPAAGRALRLVATLSSADVTASLADMARHGLVDDDSVFFAMLDKGRTDITIKFKD